MNQLLALRQYTTVVADTGDFHQLAALQTQDATTNPSLILEAVRQPQYQPLLSQIASRFRGRPLDELLDRLLVRWGCEILPLIPGRVSTQVDARLSFDAQATLTRAERLVELYQAEGVPLERVLIKIAATWEGMQAAAALERRGIQTNMTLLFSLCQAVVCAQARVRLASAFVGRIYDWHKKAAGSAWDEAAHAGAQDPGVQSVRAIYHYYKQHGVQTELMGASFRNTGQILALAGCDLLTIAPALLAQLSAASGPVPRSLQAPEPQTAPSLGTVLRFDEPGFRYALNADAMASEKLAEGIRTFAAHTQQLEQLLEAA